MLDFIRKIIFISAAIEKRSCNVVPTCETRSILNEGGQNEVWERYLYTGTQN